MARASIKRPDVSWEDFQNWAVTLPGYLRVRPDTGRLWLDIVYLLVIVAAQYTAVPFVMGSWFTVDLVTPWILVAFVKLPPHRYLTLGLIAGLAWETHSSAPIGTYICAYWILAVIILMIRETFSWHHWIPWLSSFAVAQVWVITFEAVVISVSRDPTIFDFYYSFAQLLRTGFAVAFGALLCRKWITAGDPQRAVAQ